MGGNRMCNDGASVNSGTVGGTPIAAALIVIASEPLSTSFRRCIAMLSTRRRSAGQRLDAREPKRKSSTNRTHCPAAPARPTAIGDSPRRPTAAHNTSVVPGIQNCVRQQTRGAKTQSCEDVRRAEMTKGHPARHRRWDLGASAHQQWAGETTDKNCGVIQLRASCQRRVRRAQPRRHGVATFDAGDRKTADGGRVVGRGRPTERRRRPDLNGATRRATAFCSSVISAAAECAASSSEVLGAAAECWEGGAVRVPASDR